MMEKTIAKRVGERLQDYYPKVRLRVEAVNRVKTKPGSSVYRIRLQDRDLYAKEYREELGGNIREFMGLDQEPLLIPRIIDYYEDENIILSEGVTGDTLTKRLLKSGLSWNKSSLIICSRLMGQAIGSLQSQTKRGLKKIGDLDLFLINEIESEPYFKKILKRDFLKDLRAQVNNLKALTTRVTQHHGDPSPHNILMNKGQVYLLDYSFQDNATFIDPSLYLVSLELTCNRYGLPVRETVLRMEKEFKNTCSKMMKETYDQPIWAIVKTLTYLHFLLMYEKRKKTIKNILVASVDRRYLLKRVGNYGKNI